MNKRDNIDIKFIPILNNPHGNDIKVIAFLLLQSSPKVDSFVNQYATKDFKSTCLLPK